MGRRTYDIFAGYWPRQDGEMAESLNRAKKFVATHRPDSLDWGPVESLGPDIAAGIRAAITTSRERRRRRRAGRRSRPLRGLMRYGQLQHGRALAFAQQRQHHDLPVGKLERIVMNLGLAQIDLAEPSNLVLGLQP